MSAGELRVLGVLHHPKVIEVAGDDAPSRPAHPAELRKGTPAVLHPLQEMLRPDHIEGAIREGQRRHVAHLETGVGDAFTRGSAAREIDVRRASVDPGGPAVRDSTRDRTRVGTRSAPGVEHLVCRPQGQEAQIVLEPVDAGLALQPQRLHVAVEKVVAVVDAGGGHGSALGECAKAASLHAFSREINSRRRVVPPEGCNPAQPPSCPRHLRAWRPEGAAGGR
jgi:hypothetical protein